MMMKFKLENSLNMYRTQNRGDTVKLNVKEFPKGLPGYRNVERPKSGCGGGNVRRDPIDPNARTHIIDYQTCYDRKNPKKP